MIETKFSILGGGNLGSSIATGLVNHGVIHKDNLFLYDALEKQREILKDKGFHVAKDNSEAAEHADIILIAVKPYQLIEILKEIREEINASQQIIISCVEGEPDSEI